MLFGVTSLFHLCVEISYSTYWWPTDIGGIEQHTAYCEENRKT